MRWARGIYADLQSSGVADFVCKEESIHPLIPIGTPCQATVFDKRTLKPGDAILCRFGPSHKVFRVRSVLGDRVEVGLGCGEKKGSIPMRQVYARVQPNETPLH